MSKPVAVVLAVLAWVAVGVTMNFHAIVPHRERGGDQAGHLRADVDPGAGHHGAGYQRVRLRVQADELGRMPLTR